MVYLFSIILIIGIAIALGSFLYTIYTLLWNAIKLPQKKNPMRLILGTRIYRIIRNVFLQGKLFKDKSGGIFHALMFWGFIAFGGYSASFFYAGLFPGHVLIPRGILSNAVFFTVDIFSVVVIADVIYAAVRNWVIKIPRYQGYNGFEAWFILVLVTLLMVTYLCLSVLRLDGVSKNIPGGVMEGLPAYVTPISAALASALPKVSGSTGYYMYWSLWSVHTIDFLLFLIIIPTSRHLHLMAAPLNVLLSKDKPQAQIMPIDFEKETRFGATDIRDFSWKDYVDFYACTECGRCTYNCPAFLTGKTLSPRDVIWDLRQAVIKQGTKVRKSGEKVAETTLIQPVVGPTIREEDLWSCTTCMACVEQCPVMIDHVEKIVGMRQSLVLNQGKAPKESIEMFRNLENYFSPWTNPPAERGDWAKDLGINILSETGNDDFDVLYWVGCVSSFDPRNQQIAKSVVSILKEAKINFAILGSEEKCTGDPAKRTGNEYMAETLATQNIETLRKHNVKKVITSCPHCFNSFKHDYKEMGLELEVYHHSEFIANLLKKGEIKVKPDESNEKYTYHDSCYLGRYNKVYKPPREVVASISSNSAEMEMNKSKGLCCGAGGGRLWMDETVGTKISHKRIEMADKIDASTVVTACPYCMTMLDDARKVTNREEKIDVKDMAELVAENLVHGNQ